MVPFNVFNKIALHGERELTEGAWEELRRAVILHTSVTLLMLFKVTRCSEDLTAAIAAVRFGLYMYLLLVPFQETRLIKGCSTLATSVLPQSAFMCFEVIWVSICLFTAIAAEPFVFF